MHRNNREKAGHEVGRQTDGQSRVAHSSLVRFDRSSNGMTGVAFAKIHGGKPVIGWLDLVATILRTRACLFTCIACVLICDAILARGTSASADGVQSYLEMLSIRSGNYMLRHWVVATDNFLLTDLPGYVLASLVFGRGPFLLAAVPFGVFILMLVSCLAIVHETVETTGGRRFGCYIVLLLLGVPWGSHFNDFFWSDYHVATVAVCLLAVLAASPVLSGRSIGHWRLASFAIFVFAAAFSDPLADILLSGPLFFVVVVRALAGTGRGLQEMRLAFVVLAATAASFVVRDLSARADLFITATSVTLNPVRSVGQFLSNLSALAVLSGVVMNASSAFVPDASVLPRLIGASRLVTMLLVAATGLHVVWCPATSAWPRRRPMPCGWHGRHNVGERDQPELCPFPANGLGRAGLTGPVRCTGSHLSCPRGGYLPHPRCSLAGVRPPAVQFTQPVLVSRSSMEREGPTLSWAPHDRLPGSSASRCKRSLNG